MMSRMSGNTKKRSRLQSISLIMMLAFAMTACGGSNGAKLSYGNMTDAAPAVMAEEYAYDTAAYDGGVVFNSAATAGAVEYEMADETALQAEGGQSTVAAPETSRKLIKTVNISAETEDFDALVPGLQKQVEALGGYIESISVYDVGSYYVEDTMQKQRRASLTARVPKEKLDGFLLQVGEQTNVTSRSENVEDVTLRYVDLESHKKALLTEQERLLALMEKAESVEDIITIEGRLSEVRYQLESMESQLRTYDNQIDYSTVYLSIEEVRKYSPPQKATVWQRIENGFLKNLENIGFGIRDFAIGFVIDIPYIVFWGVLIVVAVIVLRMLRRAWKKIAAKRAAARERKETEHETEQRIKEK